MPRCIFSTLRSFTIIFTLLLFKSPLARVQFFFFIFSEYHAHHPLLAAFDSAGLSTREASRRQFRLESLGARDMESHSNNQPLCREPLSAHPTTYDRNSRCSPHYWVHLEPTSCSLETSDRTSRNCLKTISCRSKPVLVMELSS